MAFYRRAYVRYYIDWKNCAVRSCRIVLLSKCSGDTIVQDHVADLVAGAGKTNCRWGVGTDTWTEDNFEDLDVNVTVMLKCLKEVGWVGGWVGTGLMWLGIGSGGVLL
jgi:hypothetical protein